jgi:hypothetical protein
VVVVAVVKRFCFVWTTELFVATEPQLPVPSAYALVGADAQMMLSFFGSFILDAFITHLLMRLLL